MFFIKAREKLMTCKKNVLFLFIYSLTCCSKPQNKQKKLLLFNYSEDLSNEQLQLNETVSNYRKSFLSLTISC